MVFALQAAVEYHNQSTLHPVGLAAVLSLSALLLWVPRRYAVVPFLLLACTVAPAQRVVIAGLDFHLMRVLLLVGWLRLAARGEYRGFRWRKPDLVFLAWVGASALAYVLLRGDQAAVVNRAGRLYDFVGMYLFFRCTVRSWSDLDRVVRAISWLALPVLALFLIERATGRNMFAFMGGVPENTVVRGGRLRCQGPFPHAILAGSFWAAWLPLIAAGWWRPGKSRALAIAGVIACLGIVVNTASSTPAMGVLAAAGAACCFVLRRHLRVVRWSVLFTLIGLHLVMQKPVWHLISRVSLASGSTGYHRYNLINQTVERFDEWWLFGTHSTAHWGLDLWDTANQYVAEATSGGLAALVLFVITLAYAFAGAGKLWRRFERERRSRALPWALAVSLFVQAVMFISISIFYAHQNLMVLMFVLASITSLAHAPIGRRRAAPRVATGPRRIVHAEPDPRADAPAQPA